MKFVVVGLGHDLVIRKVGTITATSRVAAVGKVGGEIPTVVWDYETVLVMTVSEARKIGRVAGLSPSKCRGK